MWIDSSQTAISQAILFTNFQSTENVTLKAITNNNENIDEGIFITYIPQCVLHAAL